MRTYERTRQQLDPIGTLGNGLSTVVIVVSAFAFAIVVSYQRFDDIAHPAMGTLALLLLGGSCVLVIYAASPYRAPFTRRTHNLVVISCLCAMAVKSGSEWLDLNFIRTDWGPISLGLLFLAMGPYRPARELVTTGSLAAIFVGFLTVLHGRAATSDIPVLAYVAVTIMPILALCYASAAYSHQVVAGLERWHNRLTRPGKVVSRADEDGIARSVQQDRVTILNREVLPFFLEIVAKPGVSNADRERARDIASAIRRVMVAEVDRSWLELALEQGAHLDPTTDAAGSVRRILHDDEHVANLMSYDQRTALRAFIAATFEVPTAGPDFMRIELFRDGTQCRGVVVIKLEMADFAVRSRFAPYFAVLRGMFADLRLEYLHRVLTLSFSYEQR